MPSSSALLSSRRGAAVSLQATDAQEASTVEPGGPVAPRLGWRPAAVLAGVLTAAVSWAVCAGLAVLGWVFTDLGTLAGALRVGTRGWLLSHGVGVQLGSTVVTLVPYGATVLVAVLLSALTGYAARGRGVPLAVAGVATAAHLLPVLLTGLATGRPGAAPGRLLLTAALFALAATLGSRRASGRPLTATWPGWLQPLPAAVLRGQLVLLGTGLAVLVVTLVAHWSRVVALTEALRPGVAGGVVLVVLQLALLPNAVAWAASYALGAGFTLGTGSVVAPAGTQLGALPGLPVLGALPAAGPGGTALLWWLVGGVLAGAVAAWSALHRRPQRRLDSSSLVGGLVGLLTGAVFAGLAWASGGDLGVLRLADVGPRLVPLLVVGGATLGLAGLVTGAVLGLRTARAPAAESR